MNKIYKLIWSKVKNMWVVASELAKSHTKAPNSGVVGAISLEKKVFLALCSRDYGESVSLLNTGFVAGTVINPSAFVFQKEVKPFKITVAAIVKNEAENVPTWVQAARSCADEIVVVDTGSTDDTVKRFADYGIKCFHYEWNDDFASAKNYMISLCHGDWIVLLDGDEWFREDCDVRKAIAKHHNNPITKAIIADWICLDKDRNNVVMFSGGAVRAFRNQPDVRYFRKVHENLTINYENFAFEPEFKMYHTGYSGSVNRSKHERNLRIMRTMFDFDNGKVEFPTDWRYIEDTYAGLGQFDKALWAADKMISYGVQEYSAAAWITKFNVLFAMKTSLAEMKKQFEYCFRTVSSVSGFRFLASIYYFRNGQIEAGLDNYIEGLRMLMGPQDKVAMEHTYWRMYMPEASALASAVYLQNKQIEASLYACKVCEQYCGQTDWTNRALADVHRIMNQTEEGLLGNISERVLPVLQFGKKAILATALASSLTIGMVGVANPVFAGCDLTGSGCASGTNATVTGGYCNTASGCHSSVSGGECNTASGCSATVSGGDYNKATNSWSSVAGGYLNTASGCHSSVIGGTQNTASGCYSSVVGGLINKASCYTAVVIGGCCNTASGFVSTVIGGCCGIAYACYSTVIGGGITGVSTCAETAQYSVAIGKGAQTTKNYQVAIGSACAPVTIGGNLTVIGTRTVTDGTTTKTWTELLNASGGGATAVCFADGVVLAGCNNTVAGCYSSVSGGCYNYARCNYASVSGGCYNDAACDYSSISGGYRNTTRGDSSSVSGGNCNTASGQYSSVSGGCFNTASGCSSSVSGGYCNIASGQYASVIGGCNNQANGDFSSVTGGCYNLANCNYASVTGGGWNKATGGCSSVSGGQCNIASSSYSSVSGGTNNTASCVYASVSGGGWNTASSQYSSVSGGSQNTASGWSSFISGGYCNIASGQYASVIGGCEGKAYADFSTVIGGGTTGSATCSETATDSVAIGKNATTTRDYEVAIGSSCAPVKIDGALTVDGRKTVTDGTTTKSWIELLNAGGGASYVGVNVDSGNANEDGGGATGTDAIAIGKGAVASGDKAISIGTGNQVRGDNSGAFGDPNIIDANNSYTVGNNSIISANVDGAFVLGNNVTVNNGNLPANWDSLTDEEKSDLTGEGAIALGNNVSVSLCNKVNSSRSSNSTGSPKIQHVVAVGDSAIVGEENAVALGYQAEARALNTLASGTCAKALSEGATALGQASVVHENSSFATAVGYEAEATGEGANAFGDNAVAGAKFATAFGRATNAQCEASTAIGNCAVASACRTVAIGNQTFARAEGATSIGSSSNAVTRNAVSIGNQAVANGEGVGVVAIGNCAQVGTADSAKGSSTAIGALANVQSYYSTALGAQTSVTANNSVALGAGSVASQANVVSVGAGTATDPYPATRKIINVTDGTVNTDVSTVGQTGRNLALSGSTLSLKNANGTVLDSVTLPSAPTYIAGNGLELDTNNEFTVKAGTNVTVDANGVNVVGNGTVASGNTGLISGGTLHSEVRPASNGNYITTTGTTGSNLTALDSQLKTTTDNLATEITNRTNADTALGNRIGSVASDGNYIKASSTKNVAENLGLLDTQVKANATAISNEVTNRTTAVSNEATARESADTALGTRIDGTIKDLSVIGQTITYTKGDGTTGTITTQDNNTQYTAGNGMTLTGTEFSAKAGTNVMVDANGINVVGNGVVSSENTGLVSGGTLYNEVRPTSNGNYITTTNSTGANLSALDTAIKANANAISASNDSAVKYDDTSKATITLEGSNGTKITNLKNGNVSSVSTDAVTGSQLHAVNQSIVGEVVNRTDADTALSNRIGTQSADGNYIKKSDTNNVVANIAVLDSQLKTTTDNLATEVTNRTNAINAEATAREDADTALGERIDDTIIGLSVNGQTVTYTKGDGTTGTITTQDNNTEYTASNGLTLSGTEFSAKAGTNVTVDANGINVIGNGSVVSGNTGLVSGGTVFSETRVATNGNYIQATNSASQNLTALDTAVKANADAIAGITDSDTTYSAGNGLELNGTTFTAKAGDHVSVTDNGINVTVNGTVTENNTGIVSGGTVYTAVNAEKTARESADTTLQTNITNEKTARESADTTLQTNIDNEVTARETAVSGEAMARENADTTLQGNIDTLSNIAVKYDSADTKDKVTLTGTNGTTIDNVKDATLSATSKEAVSGSQLFATNTNIATEITNRTNADTELSNRIGTVSADGNYIKASSTYDVAQNLDALDTAVKANANAIDANRTKYYGVNAQFEEWTDSNAETLKTKYNVTTKAEYDDLVANGLNVHGEGALTSNSVAIGVNAVAGNPSNIVGDGSVAIGLNSNAQYGGSVALGKDTLTTNTDGVAIGYAAQSKNSWAVAIGPESVADGGASSALGQCAHANGAFATALGYNTLAKDDSTAVGKHAQATGNYSTSLGVESLASGWDGTALGAHSTASGSQSIGIGYCAIASCGQAVAIGNCAVASNLFTIAIGLNASAKDTNAVSLGANTQSVAPYATAININSYNNHGAVGEKSIAAAYHAFSSGQSSVAVGAESESNGSYSVALGTSAKARTEGSLALGRNSQSIGLNAIALGNASYVTANESIALGSNSVASDSDVVSLGKSATGVEGQEGYVPEYTRTIQHVTAGVNDTDAVNVSQLTTGLDEKANVALDNITDAGKTVIQNATNVVSGDSVITVTPTTENGVKTYTVTANVSPDGQIADGNTGLVSGGTVYSEVRPSQNGNYIATTNTTGANLTSLDTQVKAMDDATQVAFNDVNDALDTKANKDASNVSTYTADWGSAIGTGAVASGNGELVTGGTVYDALSTTKEEITTDLVGKANVALNNVTDAGHTVIKTDAKSAINVVGGTYATVDKTDVNGVDTYTVNVANDGAVAQGDTKLVTGGTVYNALQSQNTEIQTALDGKANVGLDNITDTGKSVVRTLAQESVKVVDGSNTTVTEGTDGTYKTYAVNTKTDGAVASGNTGIVTGGTVYDAIQNAISESEAGTASDLSGKANVGLDNITDAGKNVIKSLVNVTGTGNVSVAKTNVSGVDTYTVSVDDDVIKPHYVSINSLSQDADSNYNNDGASGQNAIAIGQEATATAKNAVAIGYKVKAEGEGAFAFGEGATSKGKGTVAFTGGNKAYGTYSMAWGMNNIAGISADGTETFMGATAFGTGTEARNSGATAMGNWTIAEGQDSVAMGNGARTREYAKASLAMGQNTQAAGSGSFAGGSDSIAGGFNSFAFGDSAEAAGDYSTAIGDSAKSIGEESVALGYNSKAYGDYSVAILGGRTGNGTFTYDDDTGEYDIDVTDNPIGAFAAGFGSVAMKDYTVAIGRHATVNNDKSMALGEDAIVSADNSVALGTEAVATEQNVISVGHKQGDAKYGGGTYDTALNRKIVNVASGVNDTDAVNVKQLTEAVGDKANEDLDNITDAGHSVIKSDAKSVINVVGADKATVTKADVNGVDTYTVSVKADGAIADGNENIVSGGTVYNALQTQKNEIDTALDEKANIGLDNITDNGRTVVRSLAQEAVKVVNGTNTTVTEGTDGNAKTYAVNVTTNGTVTSGDTGVVTGGTVYDAIQDIVVGDMIGKANISLDNVNDAGHTVIKTDAKSAINVVGGNYATVDKTDFNGVDTYTVNVATDGTVADGNTKLVTGGTVYEALTTETRPSADGNYISKTNTAGENLTALDTQVKTNADNIVTNTSDITNLKDLSNITEAGESVIKDLSKGALNVVGTNRATVTKSDVNGVDTYTVDVVANGTVTQGNENLVSGGTVYEALQNQNAETATALDGKANIALDNITNDGEAVVRTLAQESVKVVNGSNTTVTEGTEGTYKTYAVNTKTDGTVSSGDTGIVTGGAVYDAIQNAIAGSEAGTATDLSGKANTALDNIADAGHDVIKTDAKSVISVAGNDDIAVNKTDVSGVDTYNLSINKTGAIASDNEGIVTGGTVFSETRPASDGNYIATAKSAGENLTALDTQIKANADAISDINTGLDDKANTSLDNITNDGETVIKNLAKGSVNVVGEGKATVNKTDVSGVDTYTVSVTADGSVAEGNGDIVSGGTVYEAIQGAISTSEATTNATLEGKANVTLDNVTDAGHDVIKSDAKSVINVTGGEYATVEKTDVNGVDMYTINVATDGAVTSGNTKLVTGGTVYEAMTAETRPASDGNYISATNTAGANLTALDSQVKTNADAISTNTSDITNLKDLSNITEAGENVIKELSKGSVNVVGADKATVTKSDMNGVDTYTVSVKADGTVTEGNENIVSGGTVYSALQTQNTEIQNALDTKANKDASNVADNTADWGRAIGTGTIASGNGELVTGGTVYDALQTQKTEMNTALGDKANVGLDNITDDGKTIVRTLAQDAVKVVDGTYTTVTEGTDGVAKTYAVNINANGTVTSGDTGLVTGGTVYDAIQDISGDVSGKANTSLNNITTEGESVVKDLAKGAVNVVGTDKATVTKTDENGVDTYTVSVKADGTVAEGNENIVSGGTVYEALQNQKTETDTVLAEKANVDASNVTDAEAWGTKIATGSVADGDVKAVSGGTMFTELRPDDGNYVAKSNTTAQNLTALDTQVKANADNITTNTSDIANLKDLSNITEAGESVIKDLSKGTVNVVGEDKATVTKSDVSGVDTYTVSVKADGIVTEGNENLVSGGTVYEALVTTKDDIATDLAEKANVDASNVASNTAKWGEAIGTGTISSGNGELVTGGTVFTETRPVQDGNYVLKENTAGANLTALDSQVKANADAITTNTTDISNLKDLSNITDAGKTVIKDLSKDSVNVVGTGKATVTKSDTNGVDTYTVNVDANGQVAQGNEDIVTGGMVYDAIQNVSGDVAGKANVALDNITTEGETVVKNLAKGAVNVVGNDDVTVTKTDENGVDTYTVSVTKNGTITEGNEGVVTGGTVYNALKVQEGAMQTALDNKANVDASNITDDLPWANALGKGVVEQGNNQLVTGGIVHDALTALNADVNTALDDKANTSLDNITTDGQTVIRDIAKGSVKVIPGSERISVTEGTDGDVKTYAVDVLANGIVEANNAGLVTGGTVYDETRIARDGNYVSASNPAKDNIMALDDAVKGVSDIANSAKDGLDGKANTNLDNISADGEEIIKVLAKGTVNVKSGDNTNVVKTDENGVDTYIVHAVGNGTITSGDTQLVTGGTVYNAIEIAKQDMSLNTDTKLEGYAKVDASNVTNASAWADKLGVGTVSATDGNLVTGSTVATETRVSSDGNYVQQSNTAGQNIAELDRVLKETRDIAESAAVGEDANAVHYDNADKGTVTLDGANGTLLTNLKDGELSATSKDAVTGKQLYETNQRVDTLETTVGTMTDGNYISKDFSVGENLSTLDTQIKSVSDGLDAVSTDIGELRTGMDNKLNTNMDNLTNDGRTIISDIAKDSVKVTGSGFANVTSTTENNAVVYNVDVQANGKVEEGNTGLVDGGTVFNSIQGAKDYADTLNTETRDFVTDKLKDKADTDLGNLTDAGKEVIRDAMKGDLDKKANVDASNIDVNAWAEKLGTGEVSDGNTGLVNGGTVFKALQGIEGSDVVKADFDAGAIRVGGSAKYDGIDVVDISKSNGEGRVMTGVITNPNDPNSAANVGYVDAIGQGIINGVSREFGRMDNKINRVGANAAAMASLTPIPTDDDTKWNIAAAMGNYRDATAGAVGVFYKPQDNVMLNLRGSFGSGDESMIGGGVTIALNKGSMPGVSKTQLAKAVNSQAKVIEQLQAEQSVKDAKIKEMEAKDAARDAEMAELKAQMAELAKQVKQNKG